jgi:hypothetical protein
MGIQINGQTDTITAIDGALTVSGADLPTVTNLNATGIVTATSFSGPLTGNATGLSGNPNISVSTIGVNGASPQTPIDAISNSSGNGITVRGRSADGLGNIRFTSNNYATLYGGFKHDASTLTIFNGIDRVTIDSSGRLTNPYQPAFIASKNSGQNLTSSVGNVVSFDTEVIDIGSNYSSNKFTAPVSGTYQFQFTCMGSSPNAGYLRMSLKKNGSGFYGITYATITVNGYESIVSSSLINLSANDYVEAEIYPSMASFALDNTGTFSGYLVG